MQPWMKRSRKRLILLAIYGYAGLWIGRLAYLLDLKQAREVGVYPDKLPDKMHYQRSMVVGWLPVFLIGHARSLHEDFKNWLMELTEQDV